MIQQKSGCMQLSQGNFRNTETGVKRVKGFNGIWLHIIYNIKENLK